MGINRHSVFILDPTSHPDIPEDSLVDSQEKGVVNPLHDSLSNLNQSSSQSEELESVHETIQPTRRGLKSPAHLSLGE